jgi:hypothetical protein
MFISDGAACGPPLAETPMPRLTASKNGRTGGFASGRWRQGCIAKDVQKRRNGDGLIMRDGVE